MEALKREVHTPSFYTVSFILCRDGERIATVSGRKQGKLSPSELIRLAILANYKHLSYFTGSWLSGSFRSSLVVTSSSFHILSSSLSLILSIS